MLYQLSNQNLWYTCLIRSAASFSVYEPFSTMRSNSSPPVTLSKGNFDRDLEGTIALWGFKYSMEIEIEMDVVHRGIKVAFGKEEEKNSLRFMNMRHTHCKMYHYIKFIWIIIILNHLPLHFYSLDNIILSCFYSKSISFNIDDFMFKK